MYREWALAQPHRYMLMFGGRRPPGYEEPEETIPVVHRGMLVFLDALAALHGDRPAPAGDSPSALARQLTAWSRSRDGGEGPPALVLRLGVTAWTRLHGIVSLELEGVFASMGLDAAALVAAEIDELIATAKR